MTWGVDYGSVDGNKPPHWPDFLAAGGSFVWIRASFSYWDAAHKAWACVSDPTFHRDWAGVPPQLVRGAYMFPVLEASQSPEEQVAVFYKSVTDAGGLRPHIDFPPCLDVEFPGKGIAGTGLDRAGVLRWLVRACLEMKRLWGIYPIIYTSGRVWNDTDADCLGNPPAPHFDLEDDMTECPLWLARYPYKTRIQAVLPPPAGLTPPPCPTPWGAGTGSGWPHQYQGDALGVPGFTATADVDNFIGSHRGEHSPLVAWAQRKLKIQADGIFGPGTEAALKSAIIDLPTFTSLCWST